MTEMTSQSERKAAILGTFAKDFWWPCLLASLLLVFASFLFASCSGSPNSPSANGNLRLMLTDAPGDVAHVNIFFTEAEVKPVDGAPQKLPITLTPNPVDLIGLANVDTALAGGAVPVGDYEWIRLNIDASKSNVEVEGTPGTLPLQTPSSEVKILGGFSVGAAGATTLTLDFDAKASLVKQGNGQWLLKPVIILAKKTVTP